MLRGKKQGPFVGRRVQEVEDGVPLLYPRYSRVEDIVVGAKADEHLQQPAPTEDTPSKSKKRKAAEPDTTAAAGDAGPVAPAAAADGDAQSSEAKLTKQEKKKLKQERKAKERAEQQQQNGGKSTQQQQQNQARDSAEEGNAPAGASAAAANTEEAQRLRGVLGFQGPVVNPTKTNFTFDFVAQVEQETQEKLARLMAADGSIKKPKKQQRYQEQQYPQPPPQQQQQEEAQQCQPPAAAPPSAGPAVVGGLDGYVPRRVFVGGMPYHYTEEKIREYWGWCGEVESCDLMTFPDSGRFRGIAFITFKDEDGYHAALTCNGEQLEGQTLKVDKCKAPNAPKRAAASTPSTAAAAAPAHDASAAAGAGGQQQHQVQPAANSVQSSSLNKAPGYNVAYVGNIAFEVTPAELQALFAPYGVTKVRLHTDQHTGKSKGYAHVHFGDESGLDRAMQLDGLVLQGRGIRVSYGQPKKTS